MTFQVLIIVGGDGGMAREVCKHSAVKSVTLCEIDEVKYYIPSLIGDRIADNVSELFMLLLITVLSCK